MAEFKDQSQYGEAAFIVDYFRGRDAALLRFLDVGAFDGTTNSNTRPLADLGWSGVCVEPSPPAFCWLMGAYFDHPRVQLVNAALVGQVEWTGTGLRRMHCNTSDAHSADQMSTLSIAHREKWQGHPFREILISTVNWADIEILYPSGFNFVNIDVEGTNLDVFQAMPIRPEMVCVEADPPERIGDAMRAIYRQQKLIGGNWIGWEPR